MKLLTQPASARVGTPCCRTLMPALSCTDTFFLPEGLLGFEGTKSLTVLCVPDIQPFFFLRSATADTSSFVCIDPFVVCPEYEPEISANDLDRLKLVSGDHAIFVALVNPGTHTGLMTANLRSPLVLNRKERLAKQVDSGNEALPLRYPVAHAFYRPVTPIRPAFTGVSQAYANSACASCGMPASA